ncbi:MAG: hypothetical protein JWO46_1542 [Nocardioidaceae bacterium]|nr:hypothetical protein [Nocardioidaceae bacterium]
MTSSNDESRGPWLRRRGDRRRATTRLPGRVSVVLSGAIADAPSIADAIAALGRQQDVPDLEVVVAPWGVGSAGVLQAIADHAPITVRVAAPSETGNAARNVGAQQATGDHLLFLDPVTRLRKGVLAMLMDRAGREPGYRMIRAVGDRNPFNPGCYLVAASYWTDSAMSFDETHGDFPEATCVRALAAGATEVGGQIWDRVPRAGAATGAMPRWSDGIEAWLRMVPEVRQTATGPEKVQWIRDLLVADLPGLLADAERLPYELQPQLADTVGAVLAALPGDDLARVPVEARAAAWLAGQAHWSQLADLLALQAQHEGQFPTRIEGTRIHADLPGVSWSALHVPPQMLEVGLEESRLSASVRRVRWVEDADGDEGLTLAVDVFAFVNHLGLSNPTIQARWVSREGTVPVVVRRRVDPHVGVVSGQRYLDQSHGSVTLLTRLDTLGPGDWLLELAITQGGVIRVGRPGRRDQSGSAGAMRPAPDGSAVPAWDDLGLVLHRGAPGRFPSSGRGPLQAYAVRREDDWIAVDVRGPVRGTPVLRGPAGILSGHVDGSTIRFQLLTEDFGTAPRPASTGAYRLVVGSSEVPWEPAAEDDVGYDLATASHRVYVRRTRRSGVSLVLRPPLRDDELGAFAQSRLLTAYDVQRPLLDRVLLESAGGRGCTGSPLAVDRALAEARPDVERLWVVEDHAVQVPTGALPILKHSREWYDALATSRWLVLEGDVPPFFHRRDSQQVLQTLAGYPSRNMGVDAWSERNYAPRRIEQMLERTSHQWSVLMAPSHRLQHWFRESFRYDGPLLTVGLPRTDLLMSSDVDERRRTTRERLGIDDDQTVLLYAPEPGAHPVYSVRARQLLDVAELSVALGTGFTVLLIDPRPGRRPVRTEGARVVDVTGHPQVADLMLASDAALFDYSALRFDYALTGKPMLFQVPDPNVRRGDARGFLFPYLETAPGPVVSTAAEVAAQLSDLDLLLRDQSTALAKFNAQFNDMADGQVAVRAVAELLSPRFRRAGLSVAPDPDDQPGPVFRVVK